MVESASGQQPSDYLKQKIALYISCRKLKDLDIRSKSDPQVEVWVRDSKERDPRKWNFVGKTEVIRNNLNPDFSIFILCDYYFERE
jgi:hypothetical protein